MALAINIFDPKSNVEFQHVVPEGTGKENGEIYELFLQVSEIAPVDISEKFPQLYLPFSVQYDGVKYITHIGFIMEVYQAEDIEEDSAKTKYIFDGEIKYPGSTFETFEIFEGGSVDVLGKSLDEIREEICSEFAEHYTDHNRYAFSINISSRYVLNEFLTNITMTVRDTRQNAFKEIWTWAYVEFTGELMPLSYKEVGEFVRWNSVH